MGKLKVKYPKSLKSRLKEVGKKHDLGSVDDVVVHFLTKGLDVYEAPAGELDERLDHVVEDQGYSSREEVIEHLLLRGLRAYEEPANDPAELEARLRGLGYIE